MQRLEWLIGAVLVAGALIAAGAAAEEPRHLDGAAAVSVADAKARYVPAPILYVTGDNRIPILCALGRLNFQHGAVIFDRTLLDTQKSVLHVSGQVSLRSQVVNTQVKADPKSFDLLDLHGPVLVQGKIRSPQISIGRVIPIPTPVFGETVACDATTRQLFSTRLSVGSASAGAALLWRHGGARRPSVTIV
jgi:hypothetical protein